MNQTNDIINGIFEFIAGCFMFTNILRLIKDKTVKGFNWYSILFFLFWGIWNLFYYPSLNQIYSFIGGIFIVMMNLIWLLLVLKFNLKKFLIDIFGE